MNTKQITTANADEKIKQLYETAFPEGEQIPWADLMRLVDEMPLDFTAYFYLRNGFRDTNVYRTYNDVVMTILMRGDGSFIMKDRDGIIHELQQFWWPDDIKEE